MKKTSSVIDMTSLMNDVVQARNEHRFKDSMLTPHLLDTDENGTTCLMHACLEGDYGLVSDLISLRAPVNVTDKNGENALFYAAQMKNVVLGFGEANIDIIKLLVLKLSANNKNAVQVLNVNNQNFLFRLFDHQKSSVNYAPELMDLFITQPFGYVFGMARRHKISPSHQDNDGKTFYQYLDNGILRETLSPMINYWVTEDSKKQMNASIDTTNKSSRVKKI